MLLFLAVVFSLHLSNAVALLILSRLPLLSADTLLVSLTESMTCVAYLVLSFPFTLSPLLPPLPFADL